MAKLIRAVLVLFLSTSSLALGQEATWPGKESLWNGHQRFDFSVDGKPCYVVIPKTAADGNPWIWRARFPEYHKEADLLLLKRGFHIARINTDGMLGSSAAMDHWDKFYQTITNHGLAEKCCLEGVSRGGLFVYGFASRWPERVACIYCDTPVCDFRSWPGGKGKGRGHQATWQRCLQEYGLTEKSAKNFKGCPIDNTKPIADARIPVLHIVSRNDEIVPPSENTDILAKRLADLGGSIEIMNVPVGTKKSGGHHFDHPNPQRVVDFVTTYALGP